MSSHGNDIHFYKKIEEDNLRNGHMRIPRSFVNKCWEEISNPIVLLLPNGAKWEVKWKRPDVDVWLSNDWKKFSEFYALDENHLLVFRYVGKSRFHVVILDQSALEIKYPLLEEATFDDEKGDNSSRHNKRQKSPLAFSSFTKKIKTNPTKEPQCYHSQDVETKHAQSRMNSRPKNKGGDVGGRRYIYANRSSSKFKAPQREESLEDTDGSSAWERANAFHSENPFFIREMHPSYVQKYFLVIPGHFIKSSQPEGDDSVTLCVSEERSWGVKFKTNRNNEQVMFTTGWMNFVKDNNLKIGDVCVFEETMSVGISFRVVIFRDREESSPPLLQAHGDGAKQRKRTRFQNSFTKRGCEGIPREDSRANVIDDSEFPTCNNKMWENQLALTIKSTQMKYMYIPVNFIRKLAIDNVNEVTLQVGKRSWLVKLKYYPMHNYGRFSLGWSSFVRECHLKAGDVCFFELIDKRKNVLKVKISGCID
ncbi:B3 domain-containing transcription factor VRN1-like [Abrus precatorius]|uniref:B3 domain-containing transcription factor VRN1-like n=1 Tax=Abrus precatorius TaxID=3816 RepID=A0A8B8M805_ABRPR|nr:B3 domain-containing transcription factor VRN1-like [Abrus precatorius]